MQLKAKNKYQCTVQPGTQLSILTIPCIQMYTCPGTHTEEIQFATVLGSDPDKGRCFSVCSELSKN